ncbi:TPA: type IV pilus biogenesis protein PilP [Salmonella enterica subsp. diarizonae serovar 61:r:-]
MPVSNKAATAAALTGAVLILLAVTGTDAAATVKNAENGTNGVSPVTVSPEAAVTLTTTGDETTTAATATATPPVPPPGSITLGMLERVQQKNLLLAAQVQTAQLQRQLEEAGSETTATSGTAVGAQPGATPAPPAAVPGMVQDSRETTRTPGPVRPQVLEISGKGSALHALLQIPDGSRPEVSTGSRVAVGKTTLTVSRISLTGVTLSDGSELSF